MMWVSSGHALRFVTSQDRQGMESFFDTNRDIMNRWVYGLADIPHSLEILEHLSLAQAEQPDIGSLWRVVNSQATLSDLLPALIAFDKVIGKGVTPEQHLVLINSVCQDIELGKPGAFRADVASNEFGIVKSLQDPCIKFIGTLTAGAEVEFPDDTSLLEPSWNRIAKHLMAHYEGTDSPTMLKLQASAWFLVPDCVEKLGQRALHEPQALDHLKHIFEYPVQCHKEGHDIGEGHLLLHILPRIAIFRFPVDIPALTKFPMKDEELDPTFAVLILSDGYKEHLREQMHQQGINERCTGQLSEMVSVVLSSQYSMLAILSTPARFQDYPDDLAGLSICINKALDLPEDQRATSLISPLVSRVQFLIDALKYGSGQAIARREATKTIERLRAHLERCRFSSRTSSRTLSCIRTTGSFDHAIGWLPPQTDKIAIF